jgi:23S rRNA (guanosine2251-2'-O)-methyltransferase
VSGRFLYGVHPVLEALRGGARRLEEVTLLRTGNPRLQDIARLTRDAGVKLSYRDRDSLTRIIGNPHHQGVIARVGERSSLTLDELLAIPASRGELPLFLALDQVQDPQNLGNLLRTAEAAGVHGVILPLRRAAPLTDVVAKAAAGAQDLLAVASVTNLVAALNRLKEEKIWVADTVTAGGVWPWDADLNCPLCIVLGGEAKGVRPLVHQTADFHLGLPMPGRISSLNVASAGAALLYEVLRQRMGKEKY